MAVGGVGGSTEAGGDVGGDGLGRNWSSSGRGGVLPSGIGLNATHPTSVNSTSGQARASAPWMVPPPLGVRKPTTTRDGRPISRARVANAVANCSEVPFCPPAYGGSKRKKRRFGYACPLGASPANR